MPKTYVIKKKTQPQESAPQKAMSAPKKLMILFTIVNRNKSEFYADLLQNFDVNMQMILSASGTADSRIRSLIGLAESDKSVIISVIAKDKCKPALNELAEKFRTVKGGKGVAYTVPMSSTIGVAIYQFLSNTGGGGLI